MHDGANGDAAGILRTAAEGLDGVAANLVQTLFGDVGEEDRDALTAGVATEAASVAARTLENAAADGSARVDVSVVEGDSSVAVVTVADRNRPFVFDSVLAAIVERHRDLRLVTHPIVDPHGQRAGKGVADAFSLVQVHLDDPGEAARVALRGELEIVMGRVDAATDGWKGMIARIDREIANFRHASKAKDRDETVRFLEWLRDGNFIFLGMRDYVLANDGSLEREGERGLGILSDPQMRVLRPAQHDADGTAPHIRAFLDGDESMIVTKANMRAVVHRRTYLDYVGVKRLDENGGLIGELRIVGLFTSSAYSQSAGRIPYLAGKVASVLERLSLDPESHSGKALVNVLDNYPRDERFQIDTDTLADFAHRIARASERPRVRVLPRVDRFNRFVSVIVLVPKERYNTRVRERVGTLLAERYDGHISAYYPDFPEGPLARVHMIVGRDGSETPQPDPRELERAVDEISADWDALYRKAGGSHDVRFDAAYREAVSVDQAVRDAAAIEGLGPDELHVELDAGAADGVHLRLIRRGSIVPLSRRVPILENMGFTVEAERTDEAEADGAPVYIHDMTMRAPDGVDVASGDAPQRLADTFTAAWSGAVDDDRFNALVIHAGLTADEVRVLRAYARYLRQTNIPFSQPLIAAALTHYPNVAADLHALFVARLDPNGGVETDAIAERIETALNDVPSLDEDRILRRLLNAVRATLRTNAFQAGEEGGPVHLAFKLDPKALDGLPEPRPFREIFVYGPEVEGVHLRFGPVARGGLRWSDRAEDYRTEVLGLVKAQQVKNAVIVPVGAKGGFYPRALPPRDQRDAWFEAGRAAYITFIRTLLSITDNIVDGDIVGPGNTVRHDGDDPYFVVAADKGTATFSDTANGIAQEVGFWLDDAFASGGSAGYDHKAMGITARGAWVAVQRHFREVGRDIQTEPFTVAGVGDMSGDVFGNGMLLSPAIKLVAAFDHRDIFVDPDPDPEASLSERRHLFEAGRSSWQDYDQSKLSAGGGVHSRNQKSIQLSEEALAALDLPPGAHPPNTIMTAILKASVDLMWFGGIGTYIKARHENNAEVGDRANDAIRIDGHECRALAIGEGANLGATQDGRIEYAREGGPNGEGGALNSDAVDNSAGVNSSDVEVNIKIALADAMRSGRLTREDRNELLASMTDEVAHLVLDNNYEQTLGISVEQRLGAVGAPLQQRVMQQLEDAGQLDRAVENLPDDVTLVERLEKGGALTRPEIGVLVSYAKLTAFDSIVSSDVPDDPALESELVEYFPSAMREPYADEIARHRLRREIIATRLVNRVVNRGGPTIFAAMRDRVGADAAAVARAFAIAHEALDAGLLFAEVHALDNVVDGTVQNRAYAALAEMLRGSVLWMLRHAADGSIGAAVERLRPAAERFDGTIAPHLPEFVAARMAARAEGYREDGVPADLSERLARVPLMPLALDVVLLSERGDTDLDRAAEAFFRVTEAFRIGRIEAAGEAIPLADYYDGLALARARDAISSARLHMAENALSSGGSVVDWLERGGARITRTRDQITDLVEAGTPTVSRMTVAASLLGDLAR